ncbi:hypothetical protein AL036_16415 [Salipiger aestuarii]|uniref:hypothetical protein n=1 Tax=Salipiger aestuarii TaxID=568098 RepID=UPI00123AAB7E|nr:hypothetical protein [Salipiger aestuarii]KAA8606029.1 hypothetical protein AL036_16415 [Salipiger aestuarii]
MALSAAERKRRQRERERKQAEENKLKISEAASVFYRTPFFEFLGDHGFDIDFDLALALAGIESPQFEDDRGPQEFVLNDATAGVEEPFGKAKDSLGRAEVIIDCLTDAAAALASRVNEYKRHELSARLAELETSRETDRSTAMKEAVRLNKMLDQLDKQVRRNFHQWKVKGA